MRKSSLSFLLMATTLLATQSGYSQNSDSTARKLQVNETLVLACAEAAVELKLKREQVRILQEKIGILEKKVQTLHKSTDKALEIAELNELTVKELQVVLNDYKIKTAEYVKIIQVYESKLIAKDNTLAEKERNIKDLKRSRKKRTILAFLGGVALTTITLGLVIK